MRTLQKPPSSGHLGSLRANKREVKASVRYLFKRNM